MLLLFYYPPRKINKVNEKKFEENNFLGFKNDTSDSEEEESDLEAVDETKPSKTKKWSMFFSDWFPVPRYIKDIGQQWVPKHTGSDPGFRRTLSVKLAFINEENGDNKIFKPYSLFNIQSYRHRRMVWDRLETKEEFFRVFIIHKELKKFFMLINQQKKWWNDAEKLSFFKKKKSRFSSPQYYQKSFNTWFISLQDWKWNQRIKRSNLLTWVWLRRGLKKSWREVDFNSLTGMLQFVKQEGARYTFKKTVRARFKKRKMSKKIFRRFNRWQFFFKK